MEKVNEQQPIPSKPAPTIPAQWEKSLSHCWPKYLDDKDGDWCVGTVDEDGRLYEVLLVEVSQYDAAGESQKIAEAIVELWAFAAALAAHQSAPERVSVPVERIKIALDAVQNAMEDAYNNAYQNCCGRGIGECCGDPEPAWSDADRAIMDAPAPAQRELSALLASSEQEVEQ